MSQYNWAYLSRNLKLRFPHVMWTLFYVMFLTCVAVGGTANQFPNKERGILLIMIAYP